MLRNILSVILVIITIHFAYSKKVSLPEAERVARNFYFEKTIEYQLNSNSSISLTGKFFEIEMTDTLIYIFNFGNHNFIIVPSDNNLPPVLAYSLEYSFTTENQPESYRYWINNYISQILYLRKNKTTDESTYSIEWKKYLDKDFKTLKTYDTPSLPLIITKWNQTFPYNELCPSDQYGPGGHVLVGCVAISMAQVMKYYNFPPTGIGTHSYYAYGYGNQNVNFANTTYEWENMPNEADESNLSLAKFLYHTGVSCDMGYGPDGSGAYMEDAVTGLVDHFNYSPNAIYVQRNDYSTSQWKQLIKDEIDNARPIIYVGYSDNAGHAWNCDGYNGEYFHMNWGWGGAFDGFFIIDNLNAGGYLFSDWQGAVIKIYPAGNYPSFCSDTKIVDGSEGTLSDGSGSANYQNDIDCFWKIQPVCGSIIQLKVDLFRLGTGDTLIVYNGATVYDNILAKFTSSDSVFNTLYSTNGSMLLHFKTDNNSSSNGWNVSYKAMFCEGTHEFTDVYGTINDGSGNCNYKNATMCKYLIHIPNALSVTLDFNEFEVADELDNLRIYNDSTISESNMVVKYSINNLPQSPLTINSNIVLLRFFSNTSDDAQGWTLHYSAELNDINQAEKVKSEFSVFPVPAKDFIYFNFSKPLIENAQLSIFNTLGEQVYNTEFSKNNITQFSLNTSHLAKGFYFAQLKNGTSISKQKIIID